MGFHLCAGENWISSVFYIYIWALNIFQLIPEVKITWFGCVPTVNKGKAQGLAAWIHWQIFLPIIKTQQDWDFHKQKSKSKRLHCALEKDRRTSLTWKTRMNVRQIVKCVTGWLARDALSSKKRILLESRVHQLALLVHIENCQQFIYFFPIKSPLPWNRLCRKKIVKCAVLMEGTLQMLSLWEDWIQYSCTTTLLRTFSFRKSRQNTMLKIITTYLGLSVSIYWEIFGHFVQWLSSNGGNPTCN